MMGMPDMNMTLVQRQTKKTSPPQMRGEAPGQLGRDVRGAIV
jgi:hypothetical protein